MDQSNRKNGEDIEDKGLKLKEKEIFDEMEELKEPDAGFTTRDTLRKMKTIKGQPMDDNENEEIGKS